MPVCSLLTSKKGVKLRLCRTAPHIWFHTIRHFHPVSFDSDSPLLSCFIPPFLFKFEVYLHWALTVLLWESPLCFYCILPFLSHIGYVIISLEAPRLEEARTWTLPPPNPPPLPKKKKLPRRRGFSIFYRNLPLLHLCNLLLVELSHAKRAQQSTINAVKYSSEKNW